MKDPNDNQPGPDPIPHGDDAGIQSPTTTGGDQSDERPISPNGSPITDEERQRADAS